jgi:hypothetical protein
MDFQDALNNALAELTPSPGTTAPATAPPSSSSLPA